MIIRINYWEIYRTKGSPWAKARVKNFNTIKNQ